MSCGLVSAQQVNIQLGSGNTASSGSVNLNLSMTATGGALPAILQWRLVSPLSSIASVNFTASPAVTSAGKTLMCSNNAGWVDCVLYGVNTSVVPNGVIATATVVAAAVTTVTTAPLTIANPAAANAAGNSISVSATGGTVTITPVTAPPSTWSISGNIQQGNGATVALSGAKNATTTADSSGNYAFAALANGSYTITPSKAGVTMTPASRAVTVNGANVASVNFSATASTGTISGTVTSGGGATVALGGAATKSVTADSLGNYSFPGLAYGNYTVAPSKTGMTFTPASRAVTLSGANQGGINFVGATSGGTVPPAIDTTVWSDRSWSTTSYISPAFSTTQNNELLLAFISTDSTSGVETVKSVTGGRLNWVLVKRTNPQGGTAEIWRAFAATPLRQVTVTATLSKAVTGSLTVMSFSGVDTSGVNGSGAIGASGSGNSKSGAPKASLVATRSQSLVLGVGNDPESGIGRTPLAGQTLVHEFVNANRGTAWVQRVNQPVANKGATVVLGDSAPTWNAYNLSIVEVLGASSANSALSELSSSDTIPLRNRAAAEDPRLSAKSQPTDVLLANPVTGEPGDSCSPGGWASLQGTSFTSQTPQSSNTYPLPTSLAGVYVKVNGVDAPLLMASAEQVNFQCPALDAGTPLQIEATTEGGTRLRVADTVMSVADPAIFTLEGSDHAVVQAAATIPLLGESGSTGGPAVEGEYIRIYASGLGEVELQLAPGTQAPSDRPIRLKNRVTVLFGSQEVEPEFAGLAPMTAGVFQVDVKVPHGLAGALVPLSLRIELSDGTARLSRPTMLPAGEPVR